MVGQGSFWLLPCISQRALIGMDIIETVFVLSQGQRWPFRRRSILVEFIFRSPRVEFFCDCFDHPDALERVCVRSDLPRTVWTALVLCLGAAEHDTAQRPAKRSRISELYIWQRRHLFEHQRLSCDGERGRR